MSDSLRLYRTITEMIQNSRVRFHDMRCLITFTWAIVAVARHLLTVVWSVLSQGKSYRHYSDERIAYKYYTWSWQLDEAQRNGLTRPQFVRYYLMRLGVGADLQHVALDPKHPHRLASESEILEMMTDLQPPG